MIVMKMMSLMQIATKLTRGSKYIITIMQSVLEELPVKLLDEERLFLANDESTFR